MNYFFNSLLLQNLFNLQIIRCSFVCIMFSFFSNLTLICVWCIFNSCLIYFIIYYVSHFVTIILLIYRVINFSKYYSKTILLLHLQPNWGWLHVSLLTMSSQYLSSPHPYIIQQSYDTSLLILSMIRSNYVMSSFWSPHKLVLSMKLMSIILLSFSL